MEASNLISDEIEIFKTSVKEDIQQLKKQNIEIMKRMETPAEKFKSFKDLKNELQALFSPTGYSELLSTNNLLKKIFWLVSILTLFVVCMVQVDHNVQSYQAHEVVTEIQLRDKGRDPAFPAVTLCPIKSEYFKNLKDTEMAPSDFINIQDCQFDMKPINCSSRDFEHFTLTLPEAKPLNCYKFNGGRNRSVISSGKFGILSGLSFKFTLLRNELLYYFVGDNRVQPIASELTGILQAGQVYSVAIQTTVDTKLADPFSPCIDSINPETSGLVKQILELNITYRQRNCNQMCHDNYVAEYASANNLPQYEVMKSFDYIGNCSQVCPLECESTNYDMREDSYRIDYEVGVSHASFYFVDHKQTEITQTEKTTPADLVSNTGGVLGLFLEVSFLSLYRFILYVFDLIFL